MIELVKEAPKECTISQYHRNKAVCFFSTMLFRVTYWVPVTWSMKRFFHITESKGRFSIGEADSKILEDMAEGIVAALYYEVRDTVASEVEESIKTHVSDKFNEMISGKLGTAVRKAMDQKALELKGADDVIR